MKIMKYALAVALFCLLAGTAAAEPVKISISQFVEHPALDAVLKGFQDDLKDNNVEVEYKIYNAQGNMGSTSQIASQIVSDSPDMVVAIATPNAQACAAMAGKTEHMSKTPLIFTAITDPVAAGLVKDLAHPEKNITGVSNQMPMDKHMAMVQKFIPGIKNLGVIYNAGEANSVSNVTRLKAAAAKLGFGVVEATVAKSSDVTQAAKSLVGKVDAVYVPTDNTVVSNIETVVKVCEESKLPLFCADTDSVKRGAVAALGFDYYQHGRQTGAMARRILAGAKPQDTPVEFQEKLEFYLSPKAAKAMGLEVSPEIAATADKIIE